MPSAQETWRMNNPEKWRNILKTWRKENPKKISDANYRDKLKTKLKAFNILGGKCSKCKFKDHRALQLDHINGERAKDPISGSGYSYYRHKFIIDYPKKAKVIYQLLCANCNWIKRYENKEFIHSKHFQNNN